MITQTSIDAGYTLAARLAEAKIVIAPLNESPLSKLVNAMYSPTLDTAIVKGVDQSSDVSADIIAASTATNPQGLVEHDLVLDEIVPVVVQCVQHGLNTARNVVNPIITAVVDDVTASVADMEKQAGMLLGVAPVFYKDVWANDALAGMVDRYSETIPEDLPLALEVPLDLDGGLEAFIKTGNTRFDNDLKAWFTAQSTDYWKNIYTVAFGNLEQRTNTIRAFTNVNDCNIDDLLFIHLVARRYTEAVPAGLAVDLATFREYITKVLQQTGQAIYRVLERRANDVKRKALIRRWPSKTVEYLSIGEGIIQVNGDVYNQWLKEGGTPEILFGAFVTDRVSDYKTLLAAGADYIKAWEKQSRVIQTKVRFERFNNTVVALRMAVTKQINALAEDLMVVPRETLHKRLSEILTTVTQSKLDNIYLIARTLVCFTMFPHTDAERILEAVDAAAKANPTIDIREAALLATIEITGQWLGEMLMTQ